MFRLSTVLCWALYIATAAVADVITHAEVDSYLEGWNQEIRNSKDAIFGLEADKIGDNIRYSDGYLYGLDSLQRLGDCTSYRKQNSTFFDCRFGLRMLMMAFPRVDIGEKTMSLYARVRNNSFHLGYTEVVSGSQVKYIVNAYEVENFQDVELGASNPDFDGKDVEDFFVKTVKPLVDAMAKETLAKEDPSEEEPDENKSSKGDPGGLKNHFLYFQRMFFKRGN